jgi:hypothetical protein
MKAFGVYLAATALFVMLVGALGTRLEISSAIYLATGFVILWYTIETWRLRKEAELQTELQNRPFVSIEVVQGLNPFVHPVNLGKGLARNVSIEAFDDAALFEIRAQLTHIAPGRDDVEPTWRLKSRLSTAQPLTDHPGDDHGPTAHSLLRQGCFKVVLRYTSIVGQQYETTIRLTKDGASIAGDRRIPRQ